ncbi:hypothetical protein HK101_010292 [Irineochytrium annulatum]|nr:hypothetical protein HK101_010292 [Irineochytrium annulatum]
MDLKVQEWEFPLPLTDYVLVFDTERGKKPLRQAPPNARLESIDAFEGLISRLLSVGLRVRVRALVEPKSKKPPTKMLILVQIPDALLVRLHYKSAVSDWIGGVGDPSVDPPNPPPALDDTDAAGNTAPVPTITPAERLRIVHELITAPTFEGGASVCIGGSMSTEAGHQGDHVGVGYVESMFAPHDRAFCKEWVSSWSKKWVLDVGDISRIREVMGDRVGFYFAFLQYFQLALIPLAVVSIAAWWDGAYKAWYAGAVMLWSILFMALWRREANLWASRWGTSNQHVVAKSRREFRYDAMQDDISGARLPSYAPWKRWATRLSVTIPSILAFVAVLSVVQFAILVVEVFFSEYYAGPFKDILTMSPMVLYVAFVPMLSSWYHTVAIKITQLENYRTTEDHDRSLASKSFILSSLLTQLSIVLVGLLFIPTSDLLVPVFSALGISLKSQESLAMGPHTLTARVVYFSLTAQLVNQGTETLLPLLTQLWTKHFGKKTTVTPAAGDKSIDSIGSGSATAADDEAFLKHVVNDYKKAPYDLYEDHAEMANQFGLIVMFSTCWPLVPLVCCVNNFIELRSDALKIARTVRRPDPKRADNIHPWVSVQFLLALLGSVLSSTFVALYSGWDDSAPASWQVFNRLPWVIAFAFFSEHVFLVLSWVLNGALSGFDSAELERRKRFEVGRRKLAGVGIGVEAGRYGGNVRWSSGDPALTKRVSVLEEEHPGRAIMLGTALGVIHEVLKV